MHVHMHVLEFRQNLICVIISKWDLVFAKY